MRLTKLKNSKLLLVLGALVFSFYSMSLVFMQILIVKQIFRYLLLQQQKMFLLQLLIKTVHRSQVINITIMMVSTRGGFQW